LWATCQISESPHAHHTAHNCHVHTLQDTSGATNISACANTNKQAHLNTNTKPSEHQNAQCCLPKCTCLSAVASLVLRCTAVFLGESSTCRRSSVDKPASPIDTHCLAAQQGSCIAESTVFSARLPRVLPDTGLLLASQHCTECRACMPAKCLHDEREQDRLQPQT
jgi:hypothetical protein